MFYKGDFDIKESWGNDKEGENISGSSKPSKQTTVGSSQTNLNGLGTPNSKLPRPTSNRSIGTSSNSTHTNSSNNTSSNNNIYEKKGSSIMGAAAAKNLIGGNGIVNQSNPTIDDDLAKRLIKNLQMEGHPDGLFQKKLNPVIPGLSSNNSSSNSNSALNKKPPMNVATSKSGGDSDLLSSMAARLAKSEALVKSQREELREKTRDIEGLKTELEIYKQSKDSEKSAEELRKTRKENVALLAKVHAMEKFLAGYGLRWTEDEQTGDEVLRGDFAKDQLLNDVKKPKYNYIVPSEIDLNVVMRRIDELNMSVERDGGCQEVYKDDRGFNRIRRADPIPIGFYRDGIAIKGFKFFKYGSNEARQILADILEGYFPYQLKKEYPNGVQLKVIDKADDEYTTEKSSAKSANINSLDEDALKPMSKEEFLAKIPKTMVKDGKIVQVRSEIEKKFDGQKPSGVANVRSELNAIHRIQEAELEETMSTAGGAQQVGGNKKGKKVPHEILEDGSIRVLTEEYKNSIKEKAAAAAAAAAGGAVDAQKLESQQQVCELKVRTTKNGQNIIVYVTIAADKLIRDVYRILDDFTDAFNYTLMSNFPKKSIPRDSTETLLELDMFPNSVLNVQEVK